MRCVGALGACVVILRCTWVSDVCPVLRRAEASGCALRFYGMMGLLEPYDPILRGMLSFFSVRMCKIFLFGVGGKSVETYLSAICDLRPGFLSIQSNSSDVVRAIITL